MAERTQFLIQKRKSVKSQITNLSNLFEKKALDNDTLRLRLARVTALYQAFEEFNDELAVVDPDEAHEREFTQIQDRFYLLAGKIEKSLNAINTPSTSASTLNTSNTSQLENVATMSTNSQRVKLPKASLPIFDGKFENWLSFKNGFKNMIGSRTDLTDIDKLEYLKSSLKDDAANKVKIFSVDGVNYTKAWELLERCYEVKRILIARHLSLILNSPILEKETTVGLSKLADDTQQHLASLSLLGVSVGPEIIVHILEGKLPKHTLERWEISLKRDEVPSLEQMYEFIYKTAVCASKRERSKVSEVEKSKFEPPIKKRKFQQANQAFMVNVTKNCVACKKKKHPLYICDAFKGFSVQKRIDTVRNAKLCYNCLRSHRDTPCKYSICTRCQKRHNTLLHIDNYANAYKSETKPTADKKNP
ncbi:uncharacterized protein [Cardiocondyla obscurior]|uniref:uncharacterized protein n=1 Tax=Cardiocondyla obscurior TaxID=286306 RepID=UPI00396571F1